MNELLMQLLTSRGYLAPAGEEGSADGATGSSDFGSDGAGEKEGEAGDQEKGAASDKESKNDDKSAESAGKSTDDKSDDKSGLSEADAKMLKDVMKWKEKARSAEEAAKKLQAEQESVKSILGDTDLEEVEKLIQEKKEQERKRLEAEGEYERIMEQMREQAEKEKEALLKQIDELKEINQGSSKTLEELTVGRAFSESPFIRENSVLPPSIARQQFSSHVDSVDGKLVVYDKPRGEKDRTPLVNAKGEHKTFEEGITHLFESHPESKSILRSKRKPGVGSNSEPTSKGAKQPKSSMNKITAGLSKLKAS